jgi:cell division protein ZapE
VTVALAERDPVVAPEHLVSLLQPPPRFADVRFQTYIPDPEHPSQAAAVAAGEAFATRPASSKRRFFRSSPPEQRPGIYFDGGFGVGKTHLLASLWHADPGPKVFGTFVEYTNLVGALGFATAAEQLSSYALVCIDEFELDDPGDTVLMSTLMQKLADAGARIGATSNTLPDRLGEGRFAAEDFLREIQGMSAKFDVIRVDGEDYRHRGLPDAPPPASNEEVMASAEESLRRLGAEAVSLDAFVDLLAHLRQVHPSRYGPLLAGIDTVHLTDVRPVTDQADALRIVVLVDRLYDRDVPVVASGIPVDKIFAPDMLAGGYRKKYFRAVSRLVALTREGSGVAEPGSA